MSTLMDGSFANISFKTQSYDSAGVLTGSGPDENNVWANTMSMSADQDVITLPKIVFGAQPGWKKKVALERDVKGAVSGFMCKNDASGHPFKGINGNKVNVTAVFDDPTPLTAGTDVCSVSMDVYLNREQLGIVAKGNSNRAIAYESTGLVTVAWVDT